MGHGFLPLLGVLCLVLVALLVAKGLPAFRKPQPAAFPYQKEPALFTPAECTFLGVLEQALGDQYRIMGKVRLADIIKVRPGVNGSARQAAFNRIQSKHLDFVICTPKDYGVAYVVELDDQSHDRANRQARDGFVDQALRAAGVPVYHFAAKRSYVASEIQKTLVEKASMADNPEAPAHSQAGLIRNGHSTMRRDAK